MSRFHTGAESTPLTPCSAFTMRTPITTSASGPRDDVAPDLEAGLAPAQAAAESEGDGDPHDEQERREDEVGDRHAVGVGALVQQEGRGAP